MDLVSKILIHKLGPNHVGIGSRTERSRGQLTPVSLGFTVFFVYMPLSFVPKLFPAIPNLQS